MPFEENQFFTNQFVQGVQGTQGVATVQQPIQRTQGQVNNYVNHTARMGTTQAVENVNYYDTYYHRINNYHTMNTNRYRDHYVDHNVYHNSSRNVYDGADYHTTSNYVVDPVYASTGSSTGGVVSGSTGTTGSTGCGCGCNRPQPPCWSPCQGGSTGNTASYRRFPGQSY